MKRDWLFSQFRFFIGRLSVTLSDTKQGEYQAFGMAGKIFGTDNPKQNVTT